MKVNIENIENMTIDEMKKMVNKDISQEQFETLKGGLIKASNMRNDLLDLITKYGIEETPRMLDILIDEIKLYFKIIYEFKNTNIEENKMCCCCNEEVVKDE